jgi:ubiquinone/menaquinone biosynthesis C-methylase UbiE
MGEDHWQLEGNAAELYQRYLVPAITTKWAEDLVDRAQLRAGDAVLDIACGTGIVARLAAKRVVQGKVTGLDLNAGMLAVARGVPNEGTPITWIEGSALALPFPPAGFDVVLCQLGLQFFPDRTRALREMHRVLGKSGSIALSVYSRIEHTPGAHTFVLALDRVLGSQSSIKRAEHAFQTPDELQPLLADAGFSQIDVQTVTKQITFPSVLDYVRFQLIATPMASLLKDKETLDRQQIIKAISTFIESSIDPSMTEAGRFSFSQEAYVATARCTA